MINLVTGLPGAGKTLWTLKRVDDLAKAEGREVYYHGIPDLILPWHKMESPEDWINLPPKSIIVIDECQSTFRPRAASVKPPPYIAEFETHRHKGLDFFLLTQHPMLVDGNIRRLAGKHFHVVRFYGFQKSTVHEFQSCRDNVDKSQKNSIATHFVFPKDVYNWYKSADAHTIKKRIPMRMIMIVLLPLLLIVVGYFLYHAIVDLNTKPKEMAQSIASPGANALSVPGDVKPGTAAAQVGQVQKQLTYVESRTPEVPGLPFTAPAYQKVVEPVTAAFPAACVMSASKGCQCYSQQGTHMAVELDVCMNIVENGIFLDWETKPKKDSYLAERESGRKNSNFQDVDSDTREDSKVRHVALNL